jgi:hypothetical protein
LLSASFAGLSPSFHAMFTAARYRRVFLRHRLDQSCTTGEGRQRPLDYRAKPNRSIGRRN